jgi:D-alanyl-D-alanine carboxypeptidase/D-alanyl-D-alanine-endopeptidase (penicillin-binding protein 4)
VDVDVDYVSGGVNAHLPDMIEDHGASDDAAGITAEVFEESELLLGELKLDAGAARFAANEVDFEVGDAEAGRFRLSGGTAAEQGAQTCLEFGNGEGFGHVVVAAAFEAEDSLIDGAAGGEDKNRRRNALRAKTLDQIEAIAIGEAEIDDEGVVDTFEGEPLGFAALGAGIDAEARLGEGAGKKITNGVVVLNDQQPHGYSVGNDTASAVRVFARAR